MNLATAAAGRLRWSCKSFRGFFGAVRLRVRLGISQRCLNGRDHIARDARFGLSQVTAGAVEAVASSGGQIMPPLMGAGAFVMVELTGTPYTGIMAAAFLPALLFFVAVWVGINAYALRYDLPPLATELLPSKRTVLITTGFFVIRLRFVNGCRRIHTPVRCVSQSWLARFYCLSTRNCHGPGDARVSD